jgi:hypothetical protein
LNQAFRRYIQEVIRVYGGCEVADDLAVVMKSRSMKNGSSSWALM